MAKQYEYDRKSGKTVEVQKHKGSVSKHVTVKDPVALRAAGRAAGWVGKGIVKGLTDRKCK